MNTVQVLVLHGSPGSGKSTLAHAIFEHLREAEQAVAVIDPDELNIVYPRQKNAFSLRNLKAIWPNYAAVKGLRVIIPIVIADVQAQRLLQDATPASKFMVCELVAPVEVLKQRVSEREPNEYWKKRLEKWVDVYHERDDSKKFGDFEITTHDKSVDEAVIEILYKSDWQPTK